MKILLVEDDITLAGAISTGLRHNGRVTSVTTFQEAADTLEIDFYHLAIIDISLSDGNGLDLCGLIRRRGLHLPVLILTAESELSTKLRGFAVGADDYLTKPFHMDELRARVQVLLKRPPLLQEEILSMEDLTLDVLRAQVIRKGIVIPLRPKQVSLLAYLLRHRGVIVRRTQLLEELWDGCEEPLSNAIDVHIKNLRKLIDRPFSSQIIRTVPGLGYIIDN